jgi:PAS domain S-box-containing protein
VRERDFVSLRDYLHGLRSTRAGWFNVIVTDREKQIFNLNAWPAVADVRDPRSLGQAIVAKAPVIGPLRNGYFSLRAPVLDDGDVEMTITVALDPTIMANVIRLHGLPPDWVAVVVDEEGSVIARNLDPEIYVGRQATAAYTEAVAQEGARSIEATTLDGRSALIVARTLSHGAWSVGVAAPRSDLAARWLQLDRILFATALGVTALALVMLALAALALNRRAEAERRAMDLVAASDARFRDGMESMGEGMQLWDAEERLVAWNSRYLDFYPAARGLVRTGLKHEELSRALLPTVFPDADAATIEAMVAERMRRFRARAEAWERRLPDGRVLEIAERATSDGGAVTVMRDVTADRQATARLALSEERFHDFAASASDWFWETDAEHRFTYLSFGPNTPAVDAARAIGKTRAEWAIELGVPVPAGYAEVAAMMERREDFAAFTYETRRWDSGEPRVVELFGKPVIDPQGRFLGYRGTGRDVTERKRQQVELQRALAAEREMNAEQRRFVAIASHEFRTPLTIIDGAAQRIAAHAAAAGPVDPAEVHKRVARIRGAVTQMTSIIDRTLSSARLEAGRIEMQTQRFDMRGLLHEVCQRQHQASGEFEIALDVPGDPLLIDADPKLLEHVFSNLVSNAVKYSGASRRIDVSAARDGDAVAVTVRDHGLGVAPDEVPKLFTRFFRARTAMGISGTGIGLHLVREFVSLHGGTVEVVSEIGRGSTFRVRLPTGERVAAIAS